MILYPAIDILEGRAVRLTRGDFDARTVYRDDSVEAARAWVEDGARWLHVVDLDGARAGHPVNLGTLERITAGARARIQYGGGLRDAGAIAAALDAGAARVVVGTAAHRDPQLLDAALAAHGEAIAVAVDVRGGHVSVAGWTEETGQKPAEVLSRLHARGVGTVVYTDVDRDGMLEGPDVPAVERVAATFAGRVIYSGGVGELHHLERLARLPLEGVIVGKALYEGRFGVAEAQAVLDARHT